MKKIIINTIYFVLSLFLLIQVASAGEQGLFLDISESSPIADRTIPINATTNPIAFTVSDSDGGPLIVQCTSSNPDLIPNDDTHINIAGKGPRLTVDTEKNEKKHLTARIIPVLNQSGNARLTFKVTDSGGLYATKSMNLTVTTQSVNPILSHYAFVPSRMIQKIKRWLFTSEQSNIITLSVLGSGNIRMDDQVFDVYQQIMVDPDQQIQIEAQPAENWQFAYWAGDLVDTQNPLHITAHDSLNVQAVFISQEEEQQQDFQGWRLNLFLSDKQTPNVPISEISLGVAEITHIISGDQEDPKLSIVTDSGIRLLSDQIITESNEQFRNIRIARGPASVLNWEFEQLSEGTFELLNAITHDVYVSDMQEVNQWHVPERFEPMDLLIHYLP
jgi:hypothetical protein